MLTFIVRYMAFIVRYKVDLQKQGNWRSRFISKGWREDLLLATITAEDVKRDEVDR